MKVTNIAIDTIALTVDILDIVKDELLKLSEFLLKIMSK